MALIRNTKDFCKIPNGYIGLRSMYAGLKPGTILRAAPNGKKKAKGKKGKAGVKARAKAAKAAKKAPTKSASKKGPAASGNGASAPTPAEPQAARPSIPVKSTIREVLPAGAMLTGP